MANLQYITQSNLTDKVISNQKAADKNFLFIGIPAVCLLSLPYPPAGLFFLFVLGIIYLSVRYNKENTILSVGASGESKTLKALAQLSDDYTVFNQVKLPDPRSRTGYCEADFIVVGPTGVFVIESKDYNGTLAGHESDRDWRLHKTGRRGTDYTTLVRNPVKQVKKYVAILGEILKASGVKTWVNPIVSLTNGNNNSETIHSLPILPPNSLTKYISCRNSTLDNSIIVSIVNFVLYLKQDKKEVYQMKTNNIINNKTTKKLATLLAFLVTNLITAWAVYNYNHFEWVLWSLVLVVIFDFVALVVLFSSNGHHPSEKTDFYYNTITSPCNSEDRDNIWH